MVMVARSYVSRLVVLSTNVARPRSEECFSVFVSHNNVSAPIINRVLGAFFQKFNKLSN